MSHDVSGFVLPEAITPWGFPIAVTIYRKKVRHRTAKNFQLDLFDPNDGYYEYSAVASNLPLTVRNLWHFMGGRGNHEKTIGQLKTGLAFHTGPTNGYAANSAWQQLVALAHNLLTNFQMDTGAAEPRRSRKHTVLHLLRSVQTLRFRGLPSRRDPRAPEWGHAVAAHEQRRDARSVHAHRERVGTRRLSFLTHCG